ncbi:MAG: hypothetical protein KF757_00050 [Phycisphaeraceae bacterium]|nr:hypothetical protein [Phycisphaeraceae bacterium]
MAKKAVLSVSMIFGASVCLNGCVPQVIGGGHQLGEPRTSASISHIANNPSEVAVLSVKEIGDRVEARYREAKSIRSEGVTERAGHRLEFTYDGTPEALRTLCMYNGEVYGLFSYDRGRIQEFVPGHPQRLVLMYDGEYDDQVGNLVYTRPLDCLYGMQFGLWVGPKSILKFGENIRNGRHVRNQQIGEIICYVVEWDRYFEGNEEQSPLHLRHVYYIDTKQFVVRRWDSIRNDDVQTREYSVMEVGSRERVSNWDVWPLVPQLVSKPVLSNDNECSAFATCDEVEGSADSLAATAKKEAHE